MPMLKKIFVLSILFISAAFSSLVAADTDTYCPPMKALSKSSDHWVLSPEYTEKWTITEIRGNFDKFIGFTATIDNPSGNPECYYGYGYEQYVLVRSVSIKYKPDTAALNNKWDGTYIIDNGQWLCDPYAAGGVPEDCPLLPT